MASMDNRTASLDTIQTVNVTNNFHTLEKVVTVSEASVKPDIEHAVVKDDPREWSKARKYVVVVMICAAAMIAGLGGNIYNPAIAQIEADLHATSGQLSLTVSLFILIQGGFPVFWSAISEIQGRKVVYLASITLCTLGCIVSACSKTVDVLIGMRCMQAAGASAVVTIGAATLADLFEPSERGKMMGIYLCAPLLGPSLGPVLGGILTQAFNWRATFWFLVIFTGLCAVSFIFFKDTFRQERSLTYQSVVKKHQMQEVKHLEAQSHALTHLRELPKMAHPETEAKEGIASSASTIVEVDTEAQVPSRKGVAPLKEVPLTWRDVNPVGPIVQVLRRWNNDVIILASALLFAFEYSIMYTASLTLARVYHYDALKIGLVLLAFGSGCLLGSILGGRYSDYILEQMKTKNGGKSSAEMRLQSTMVPMIFFPFTVVAYGWVCEKHVHIAAVCVMLFLAGFFMICIYTSTLAYIVDANTGRSSSAVATNSCVRGLFGFVATEVAVPLQNAIGDGGLYSMWAGLMVVADLLILLVWWKGGQWREKAAAREASR